MSQQPTTTGKCRSVGTLSSGAALFGGSTGNYIVQIQLPIGTTTFPTSGPESVVLTSAADTTQVWEIGKAEPATSGTATLEGTHATVDVDLLPAASSSGVGPVHLTGALDC